MPIILSCQNNIVGLEVFATDDPEITSHPANCLMARIGNRITLDQQQDITRS
jgi:hypothetical protein